MSSDQILLPYGEEEITLDLTNGFELLSYARPNDIDYIKIDEVHSSVLNKLTVPIGSSPLAEMINPDDNIVIVVDDISRPTPTPQLVAPLIEYLTQELAVPKENITFIFGLGVHRKMDQSEAEIKLGQAIASEYSWENHDCYENLVDLGKSKLGTPIMINKTYHEADFRISIGLIEPHLWAGFSGGAKGIMPGVMGVDTIVENHKLVMKRQVRVGNLENNPFREDIEDIVDKAGLEFIVNCVLTPQKQIHDIVTGDPRMAFMRGVELSQKVSEIEVPQQSDIIISSPSPLGIDFRQSSKAAFNTMRALRKGGVMIVVSSCPEGRGNIKTSDSPPKRWLIKLLAKVLPSSWLMKIIKKQGYGVEDAAGTFQMFKFISNYHYIFVSDNMSEQDREILFVADHVDTVDEALKLAKDKVGRDSTVNVFPQGGATFPKLDK